MKVMVSFLGTSTYLPCRYTGSDVVRFVQTALVLHGDFDRVFICCTREVEVGNWPKLCDEFRENDLSIPTLVRVPMGRDEAELWTLFQTVGSLVNERDHISFDITHSIRSLPVLFMVLVQYLQVTKKVVLDRVCYGAFESLGEIKEINAMEPADRKVPVFDLTPFFRLNDWSSAIAAFSEYGVAKPLCDLAHQGVAPLLRESKGADQSARAMRCIANTLEKHAHCVRMVRGNELAQLNYQSAFLEQLDQLDEVLLPPMRPVLEKLREQFKEFTDADTLNGIRAARWCLDHGMIQQGITLLQETVITCLSKDRSLNEIKHKDEAQQAVDRREFTSNVLNVAAKKIHFDDWGKGLEKHMGLAKKLYEKWVGFADMYQRLSVARNDINHGGMIKNARKSADVESAFSSCLKFFEARINDPDNTHLN